MELLIGSESVEVRSLARFGFGDSGRNRARIEALRQALVAAGVESGQDPPEYNR